MSVAPSPFIPEPTPRRQRSSSRSRRSQKYGRETKSILSNRPQKAQVKPLPKPSAKLPPQLKIMLRIQQFSSVITFALILTTLGVYACTVYVPKLWSKEYKDLETLQRHERNLIATNESLKHKLARQAERPETGLAAPHPAQAIFLPDTPVENIIVPEPEKKAPVKSLSSDSLAY